MLARLCQFTLVIFLFTAALGSAPGKDEPDPRPAVPPGGTPVFPAGDLSVFYLGGGQAGKGSMDIVPVEGMPFAEALRICSEISSEKVYDVQVSAKSTISLRRDDWVLAVFYARAIGDLPNEEGAKIAFLFEKAMDPWTNSIHLPLRLGSEWKKFSFPFRIQAGSGATRKEVYQPEEMKLSFNIAFFPQCVEIGGIECIHYGRDISRKEFPCSELGYEGMELDAPWREAARERIEKTRKGDLTVVVNDSDGKPVEGAEVHVKMIRHAFPFGTVVNAWYLLSEEETEDLRRYKQEIPKLFNRAVMEGSLKWPSWHRDPTLAIRAIDWLREQGLDVRGHVLVWPRFYHSPWRNDEAEIERLKADLEELRRRIADHVRDEVTRMRGKIVEWDVINEPYWNHEYMDLLGDEVMVEWFRIAHEADPTVPLFLNDNGILASEGELNDPHQQHYEKTVRYLIENGAPLGGLGMQSHVKWVVTGPEKLLQILDRFVQFNLPMVITEYDQNIADESLQADYMRDFMTVIFSHPSVHGFLMWGFWDGKHWLGNAPIYREDWSLKPSGEVYMDLVFNQWWTDVRGKSDAKGKVKVKGFLGEYEVTVRVGREEKVERLAVGKGENVVVIEM